MKYLAFAMKVLLMLIGLILIYRSWEFMSFNSDCLTGLAIFITGLYLWLQGKYGSTFSGCIFGSPEVPKKKGFFS